MLNYLILSLLFQTKLTVKLYSADILGKISCLLTTFLYSLILGMKVSLSRIHSHSLSISLSLCAIAPNTAGVIAGSVIGVLLFLLLLALLLFCCCRARQRKKYEKEISYEIR